MATYGLSARCTNPRIKRNGDFFQWPFARPTMNRQRDQLFDLFEPPAPPDGDIVQVAFDSGADSVFDYRLEPHVGAVQVGQRVEAPFGKSNQLHIGFVVNRIAAGAYRGNRRGIRLKSIARIVDDRPLLTDELMRLAEWLSRYYVCPLGQVLSAMVPAAVKQQAGVRQQVYVYLAADSMTEAAEPSAKSTLRGKMQQRLIHLLRTAGAVDEASALAKECLLEQADCAESPLKQLIAKGIVRTVRRRQMEALPQIPPPFTQESGQVVLNADQQRALDHIRAKLDEKMFSVTLLHGVTDSGKTEVYIRAVEACIQHGRQAIVLLPEIALTAQTVQRFSQRFARLAILHSQQSASQRNANWQAIRAGQVDVVIGARSAVFAPLSALGLVVVDEEHEPSYKQDTAPRYHGRDVAIKRCQLAGALCLLGSATPSLESIYNCRTKKFYTLLEMPHRVRDLPMPAMRLVDMTTAVKPHESKQPPLLSQLLLEQLKTVLSRGEQAILLLNRRGYSNYVFCPTCRHCLTCRNCDVTLVFHRCAHLPPVETLLGKHIRGGYAVCHYCQAKTLAPQACPLCGTKMLMIGIGTQRLEEELGQYLPTARVRRVDSDAMAGQDYYRVLAEFADGKIDILAGTQILAKGLHFPNVTLVGVVSADTALSLPDFRANERTFQLISQVAGRAGRSEKPGIVIVQTYLPQQPAIQFAIRYDYKGFIEQELKHRQHCQLPPFWRLAIIHLRDTNYQRLTEAAENVRLRVDMIVQTENLAIQRRGPMPAPIERIQRHHRLMLMLQAQTAQDLETLFDRYRKMPPIKPAVHIQPDIDPINVV